MDHNHESVITTIIEKIYISNKLNCIHSYFPVAYNILWAIGQFHAKVEKM